MIDLLVLLPVLSPHAVVLGSWRDQAETRGDVQAPGKFHSTQHGSHGCALGENHGVRGGSSMLWLHCRVSFSRYLLLAFSKKKKAMVCSVCLCLSCACCHRCCLGRWVLVGESLFPPWQQLSDLSVSSQDFPPPVLLLRSKIARYRHVQGGMGKEAGTPLCWESGRPWQAGAVGCLHPGEGLAGWCSVRARGGCHPALWQCFPFQKWGSTFQCGFSMDRNVGSAICWVPSCLSLPAAG